MNKCYINSYNKSDIQVVYDVNSLFSKCHLVIRMHCSYKSNILAKVAVCSKQIMHII